MTDLTPHESAALRARIVHGADGLPPRRSTSRMVAVASAVVVVGVIAVGSVSMALGLGSTTDTLATPSPTPTVTDTPTPSPTPTRTPTETPTPAPTPTPTPTPTQEPTQEPVILEIGDDIVSEGQWNLLNERAWGFYFFSEQQRYVATDPSQSLPAAVTADIQRRMDAIPNNTFEDSDGTVALQAAYNLGLEARSTGKEVVTIRYNVFSVPGEPNGLGMRWYARSSQSTSWWMPLSKNRDQLIADVNAWIAANTTPGSWVVFVGPGEPVVP